MARVLQTGAAFDSKQECVGIIKEDVYLQKTRSRTAKMQVSSVRSQHVHSITH